MGRQKWYRPIPLAVGSATAVALMIYLIIALSRWFNLSSPSWDLAIFEQAVRGYAEGTGPIIDVKGPGTNQLGDHFSPALALLALPYRVFPSAVTLLVIQCGLVAWSVGIVAIAAGRVWGGRGALCLGLAYGLSWGLATGINAEFHEYALAVPFIALSLSAYLGRRWLRCFAFGLVWLFIKEDLAFNLAALGLVMALSGLAARRRAIRQSDDSPSGALADATVRIRLGFTMTGLSLVLAAVVFGLVIPYFRGGEQWEYWNKVPAGSILDVLAGLWNGQKILLVALLLGVTLGVAVASPLFLVALPTLAWRLVSDNPHYWGTAWHYSMILMPIVFLAAIDAARRLKRSPGRLWRALGRHLPLLSLCFALAAVPFFPGRAAFMPSSYHASPDLPAAETILRAIPDDTLVVTDTGLMSRLSGRCRVVWLGGGADQVVPDYILFDKAAWASDPGEPAAYGESVYPGTTFVTVEPDGTGGENRRFRLAMRIRP
ncbi:MAG: DUF2079 domain-containing protein [Bifidobacteriaceae bacterium]|nr:DUF2079 domain-containing protein [Bifidobacteriaceae bacterium]